MKHEKENLNENKSGFVSVGVKRERSGGCLIDLRLEFQNGIRNENQIN